MAARFAAVVVLACSVFASAQPASTGHAGHGARAMSGVACAQPTLACASAVMPAFDRQGRLWLAGLAAGAVFVTHSDDLGRSFAPERVVDTPGAQLDLGADARPQIAVDESGTVVVAWGVFKDKEYNARVMLARSHDRGRQFGAPVSLSADAASQRFPALAFAADGRLFAAWLDKRTVAAARRKGMTRAGAALAFAWSTDGGVRFEPERIAVDSTCECCRLAIALDADQRPAVLLRAIFPGGERDHLLTRWTDGGKLRSTRVAADRWKIDACPHHGPALALGAGDVVHAAWFTQGEVRQGLYYARSTDGGASFGAPMAVGSPEHQAGHPALLARGDDVWLAWKEFDGQRISVWLRRSADRGATWDAGREVAATRGSADHPVLVADARAAYLSWHTRLDGYRLIPLEP